MGETMPAYRRFIVLGDARTGSTLLVQALHSHPAIRCFREVFHGRLGYVDFSMEGYDNFDPKERLARKEDPPAFLRSRIFRDWPPEVRAVGFKLLYFDYVDFPGLLEALTEDRELHVIHIQRRNLLRVLVSRKRAEATGVWVQDARRVNRARLLMGLRHPLRAATRLTRLFWRPAPSPGAGAPKVTIAPQECLDFALQTRLRIESYERRFAEHPRMTVHWRDLDARLDETVAGVERFLGVEPRPAAVTLRRQNPEPLRELIANYDELYEALKDTPDAPVFFDDERAPPC